MASRTRHSILTRIILTMLVTAGIVALASCHGWRGHGAQLQTCSVGGQCQINVWVKNGHLRVEPKKAGVSIGDTITWHSQDGNNYAIQFKRNSNDPFVASRAPGATYDSGSAYVVRYGKRGDDDKYTISCPNCNPSVSPLDPHVIIDGSVGSLS